MTLSDPLLTEAEYAELRGVSVRTIKRERAARRGPPYIRLGRKVFYRRAAIEQWIIAQEVTPVRSEARESA